MAALKEAARKGRGGDTRLGHLSNGDVVIPREIIDDKTRKLIHFFLKSKGHHPGRFTVGEEENHRNPRTRLPEFDGSDPEGAGAEGTTGGTGPGSTGGPGSTSGGTASSSALDGMHDFTGMDPGTTASHQSETVVDAKSTPPVSNTMSQTGIPGAINDLENTIQSKVTDFNFDPASALAAMGINVGIGMLPGGGIAAAIAGLLGHDLGHDMVGLGKGINNGSVASSAPSGLSGLSGGIGGDFGSLGGNVGVGFDDMYKRRLRSA